MPRLKQKQERKYKKSISEFEFTMLGNFSFQLIATKPSGMWNTRFPIEYKEKYGEDLPQNYTKLLETWTDIIKIET